MFILWLRVLNPLRNSVIINRGKNRLGGLNLVFINQEEGSEIQFVPFYPQSLLSLYFSKLKR